MDIDFERCDDQLYVLWTNPDPDTSENMVMMYVTNAMLRGWWKKITVIVWGGSQKTLLDQERVLFKSRLAREKGVEFSACISCAENQGLSERLREEGIGVRPWGEALTQIIRNGCHLLTV